jgi:hypothetical protein
LSPELERIFHEIADLDPEERRRWLDEHCPDPELRAEAERLVEFDQGSEEFLLRPVRNLAAQIEPPAAPPRERRRHRLLRPAPRQVGGTALRAGPGARSPAAHLPGRRHAAGKTPPRHQQSPAVCGQ